MGVYRKKKGTSKHLPLVFCFLVQRLSSGCLNYTQKYKNLIASKSASEKTNKYPRQMLRYIVRLSIYAHFCS